MTSATPATTLMLSGGIHPKVVAEMLGHATVAVTLDIYSHVTPDMQREAGRLVTELLPWNAKIPTLPTGVACGALKFWRSPSTGVAPASASHAR